MGKRPSMIEMAHGGDLEAVRREIETSTAEELEDRYGAGRSTIFKWEVAHNVRPSKVCISCKQKKLAVEMRVTRIGAVGAYCQAPECEPKRPGQQSPKTSDRERTLEEYATMPAVMYQFARLRLTRRGGYERPYYWQQGAIQ
jgi:hypothetical protein